VVVVEGGAFVVGERDADQHPLEACLGLKRSAGRARRRTTRCGAAPSCRPWQLRRWPEPPPGTTGSTSLHLWLASQPRPYGILTVDRHRTAGLLDPQDRFFCPTLLTRDSFAYLAIRRLDDTTWQYGAHGFGPDATGLIDDLNTLVTTWDRLHRAGIRPAITVHPTAAALPDTDRLRLVVHRRHTHIAITWPDDGSR